MEGAAPEIFLFNAIHRIRGYSACKIILVYFIILLTMLASFHY